MNNSEQRRLSGDAIRAEVDRLLGAYPGGLSRAEILRVISPTAPASQRQSIGSTVSTHLNNRPAKIERLAPGLFGLRGHSPELTQVIDSGIIPQENTLAEKDFYEPFAQWLVEDQGEVTAAVAIGGASFGNKWGTPDVIGVQRSKPSDLVKFEARVVAAEIKTTTNQSIIAFGQAVSYRLFAHKSYIVVPDTTPADDINRLERLSVVVGIGLITFKLDASDPDWRVQIKAAHGSPDMFYVNQMASKLRDTNPKAFDRLF